MPQTTRARTVAQLLLILAGLSLPTLSLVPLGGLWLWEHGVLLPWAICAAAAVGLAYALLHSLQRRQLRSVEYSETVPERPDAGVDPRWSAAEAEAWRDVRGVADRVDVAKLVSREALLDLGLETVRVVARRLHPEIKSPVWQFTVPEGLALLEQVSRRMARFTIETIPFSEHLTVGQALTLYRWRGALSVVDKALDIWRLVRVVNLTTAATHELRERLARQMYAWGRAHIGERLARAYVNEVGRAAIDLYGGRLRVLHAGGDIATDTPDPAVATSIDHDAFRILIAGQPAGARARLARAIWEALAGDVDGGDKISSGAPPSTFISIAVADSVSVDLSDQAAVSDVMIWVASNDPDDLLVIRGATKALRDRLREAGIRVPTMLVVMSPAEGAPPNASEMAAQQQMLSAEIGLPIEDIVAVAPLLIESIDASQLSQRLRAALVLASAERSRQSGNSRRRKWRRIWSQTVNAGYAAARMLRK